MKSDIKVLVIKRVLLTIPVLLGVSVVSFLTVAIAPSTVIFSKLGLEGSTPEAKQRVRTELGLDEPLPVRYFDWLGNALQGDLGRSWLNSAPVTDLLIDKFLVSAELGLLAFVWMLAIAIPLGISSAFHRNRLPDHVARIYAILGISVPSFVVGLLLILVFGVFLGWLPAGGWVLFSEDPVGNITHAILPSYSMAFIFIAIITRIFRSDLLETMNQEHVMAAKSMGLPKNEIIRNDIIKPAIIPTLTSIGMALSILMAGLVLIELVFVVPGLGRLMANSVFTGDLPVLQGAMFVTANIFVAMNLIVDVAYYYLDPRIRVIEGDS